MSFAQQNSIYENLGDGRFVDVSDAAGAAFADRQVSRGLATGDLDGDGALDVVVTNNGGAAQLLLNESSQRGGAVVLWLEGDPSNRSAIGTRVVATSRGRTWFRQVMGAQSYLSVSDLRVHLGLGDAPGIDELVIHWPVGARQSIGPLAAGGFYHVRQGRPPRPFIPGRAQLPPR